MKVTIINNGVSAPRNIISLFPEDSIRIVSFAEISVDTEQDTDLFILSGSSQFPIIYNIERLTKEINLIQNTVVPIIGICYGCELIAITFGGTLADSREKRRGVTVIHITKDADLFGKKESFDVYDAHRWAINSVPESLEVLAASDHGPEIIRHKTRPIYGFQFHPEKMVSETEGYDLFMSVLRELRLRK